MVPARAINGAVRPAHSGLARPIETTAATLRPFDDCTAARANSVQVAVIRPTKGSCTPRDAANTRRSSSGRALS